MRGRLIDLAFGVNGKQRITIELDDDFRTLFDELKEHDVRLDIKRYRKRRSLNANAYFHVLVNKIAGAIGADDDEVKINLVLQYGTLEKDSEGSTLGFKLPATADPRVLYKYVKEFDTRQEDGITFKCYLVYKRTRDLDTKEMAQLIDGTVYEAKELGIQTLPPAEIERMKQLWGVEIV